MEFRETLLAAQRNQQQKSSDNCYYKARFDPPKKEQKQKDRLSANIQKFLAKKDEEEKRKKLDTQRKREELLAMRDPKDIRKIQKTLKVIKSANKSVIQDAVDRDNTAVTREGPDQPDQDDYGYESQEAAAIYAKMMQKYSKIPEEPKFPMSNKHVKKDLNCTRERVKHALQHEDDPVPHKRRRKTENGERDSSPPTAYEPEKKKDEKSEKPKIRKPAPPPMDFNQLLKLAEQKKSEPLEAATKKTQAETEPERLMTKKQKREYEEEMARRQRRQERLDAERGGRREKEDRPAERERKPESGGFNRIPKLSHKNTGNHRNDSPRPSDRDRSEREKTEKLHREKDRVRLDRDKKEKERSDKDRIDKLKAERDRIDREIERDRLEKLKAERERIDRDIDRLNRDRERLEKTKLKLENSKLNKPIDKNPDRSKLSSKEQSIKQDIKKSIDLKSQNTYRIDKSSDDKKFVPQRNGESKQLNGHSVQGKSREIQGKLGKDQVPQRNGLKDKIVPGKKPNGLPESSKGVPKKPDDRKPVSGSKPQAMPSKPAPSSFDFDKHINSLGKNGQKPMDKNGSRPDGSRQFPPGDVRRKMHPDDARRMQKRRAMPSDSEYDSEMNDFIDDGDENMDYSRHIKEIFGYDKFKYRDMDDDDDPMMESSFARQQREEYISKKIGIMEDLEDMRIEAMEKKKSKKRRISDDD